MAPRDHGPPGERPRGGSGGDDDGEAPWSGPVRMPAANADEDQEIWLLSYSDLVTLLLSVFVMLLAISTLKDQLPTKPMPPESPALVQDGRPAPPPEPAPLFDDAPPLPAIPERVTPDDRPRLNPDEVAVTAPDRLAARWRETLADLGVPPAVTVDVRQNRVDIVIGDGILFAPGQVELTLPGLAVLRRLAPTLTATRGEVVVEGHTDSVPITSGRFPSNWELSGSRASSVVRRLIELGVPAARLSAVGYADTRPIAAGTGAAANARNRRVTITIQADG